MESTSANHQEISDRLSSLPDTIICHILSFLPTNISVSTSILARRWRFLWAYVPILDFDVRTNKSKSTSFSSIVHRVMLLHRMQTLNTFRIYCHDGDCSQFESETWVATTIERNVQNLDLFIVSQITENISMLPLRLFTCRTLVDLRLGWCALPAFTGVISLPSLKKIYLEYVEYLVDDALPRLLSGCPVLDELILNGFLVANRYMMSSPAIKRLTIDFSYNLSDYSRDYKVEINAPALKYLVLMDGVASHISTRTLTSLIEAKVVIYNATGFEDDQYYLSLLRFVDCLCKVKCLKLAIDLVLPSRIKPIARFGNCTRLYFDADWVLLTKFLERADNLEVLVISKIWFTGFRNWVEPEQMPTCVLSCLRTVRVDQFECTEVEFEMVRYFLLNATVLKRMEIHFPDNGFDLEPTSDAKEKIALFQRQSEACELVFLWDCSGLKPSHEEIMFVV